MALGPHPEFSWSASRARTFRYCRRQYWFQYYGHWNGWEDGAPERTRTIYRLKQLQSLATWAGSSVHRGVANLLASDRQVADVVDEIHRRMRNEYLNSVRREFRKPRRAKSFGLDVHEYGLEVPKERFTRMWDNVKTCLETFPDLPHQAAYGAARAAGGFAHVEDPDERDFDAKRFRWDEIGDFPIYAIPDMAYQRADGTVEILDWKTGRAPTNRPKNESTLQLVLYARFLKARNPELPGIHDFEVAEVYLPDGQRFGARLDELQLGRATQAVSESVEAMRGLLDDRVRNVASEECFELIEDRRGCRWCVFRAVCPGWGDGGAAPGEKS
jgi:hypothetical protein